jgi:hypothetical protein
MAEAVSNVPGRCFPAVTPRSFSHLTHTGLSCPFKCSTTAAIYERNAAFCDVESVKDCPMSAASAVTMLKGSG